MSRIAILIGTGLLLAAPPAAGNPGGGGSPPSATAPGFDAASEYRNGIEALKAGSFADAKKAFTRVLDVAPKDANTNYLAGLAFAGLEDFKGARRFFEKAVRYDGEMVLARQELAVTYARLGERSRAEAELAKLRSMSDKCGAACPQAEQLGSAMAKVTAALGEGPLAQVETRPSLVFASAAAGDGAYLAAIALINQGHYAAALESLDRARASFGGHPDVLTYLGFANRKLGRFPLAEAYYRAALAVAPGHKGATEYFGELMVEQGDLAGARAMLARLEALCSFGCAEADELRRWIEDKRPS